MVNLERCYGWSQGFISRYGFFFSRDTNCRGALTARLSTIRRQSTRKCRKILAIKTKARTGSGEGGEEPAQ